MRKRIVQLEEFHQSGRLDSWYYLSPGDAQVNILASARSRAAIVRLGGTGGVGRVWAPARFKRVYAIAEELSVPYLRPYDVFNYLPEAADWLSARGTRRLDAYRLKRGMILQTCSGRNLGPAVYVDGYLEPFALSHDMIRVEIDDEQLRYYILAFLNSTFGRVSIRRDKSGSVIDHISVEHLSRLEIIVLGHKALTRIASMIERALNLREAARVKIDQSVKEYEALLPQLKREDRRCHGWTVGSNELTGRLDAASYDPLVKKIRQQLSDLGGDRVNDVADVVKPGGRYKTRYVTETQGVPLLSGSQVLQDSPINLQFMDPTIFRDVGKYELRAGWIVYPADGRAEEELGAPAMVTKNRDRWLASGHVGRVVPRADVDVGWLFLALKTRHVQLQLKARASGSVVDSTFAGDMTEVILPPRGSAAGEEVVTAWDDFNEARALEEEASSLLDRELGSEAPSEGTP